MNHFLQKILLLLYPLQRTFRASPTIFFSPYINIYMQCFWSLQMHLHLKFIFHVISFPFPSIYICNIYCFLSKTKSWLPDTCFWRLSSEICNFKKVFFCPQHLKLVNAWDWNVELVVNDLNYLIQSSPSVWINRFLVSPCEFCIVSLCYFCFFYMNTFTYSLLSRNLGGGNLEGGWSILLVPSPIPTKYSEKPNLSQVKKRKRA